MERVAVTEVLFGTVTALFIQIGKIAPEEFEAVLPDIFETVFEDISLDGLGTALDIEASDDIAVCGDAGRIDAGDAKEVPVTDFTLIFVSEIMTASVADRFACDPFVSYEFKDVLMIFRRQKKFRVILGAAHRFDADDTPGVDVHLVEDLVLRKASWVASSPSILMEIVPIPAFFSLLAHSLSISVPLLVMPQ